jgi:hypothetical protein
VSIPIWLCTALQSTPYEHQRWRQGDQSPLLAPHRVLGKCDSQRRSPPVAARAPKVDKPRGSRQRIARDASACRCRPADVRLHFQCCLESRVYLVYCGSVAAGRQGLTCSWREPHSTSSAGRPPAIQHPLDFSSDRGKVQHRLTILPLKGPRAERMDRAQSRGVAEYVSSGRGGNPKLSGVIRVAGVCCIRTYTCAGRSVPCPRFRIVR